MEIGLGSTSALKKKNNDHLIIHDTWKIVGTNESVLLEPLEQASPDQTSIYVIEPANFAGEYTVNPASLELSPQPARPPEVDGAPGTQTLSARNGLWFFKPGAYDPVTLTGRWVREGAVPILQASGLQYTSRDAYPQPFLADTASPATWQERAETSTGTTGYVTAIAPPSSVPNPFASLIARNRAGWAYQDFVHLGGMFVDLEKSMPITGYGQRARVVADKSGNGHDSIGVNSSSFPTPQLINGAIWDDNISATGGRNIAISLNGATEFTFCAAVRLRERQAASADAQTILCARATASGVLQTGIWFNHDANRFEFRVRIGSTSTLVATATPAAAPSSLAPLVAVATLRKTATGVQAWLNGVGITPASTLTGAVSAGLANNIHLMTSGTSTELKDGWLGPWLAAGFALSDTEIADLHAYYMSLTGISA